MKAPWNIQHTPRQGLQRASYSPSNANLSLGAPARSAAEVNGCEPPRQVEPCMDPMLISQLTTRVKTVA